MILGWRDLWLCHLCGKGQLLLRRAGPGPQEVFLALGALNNAIVVAWPVELAGEYDGLYQLAASANVESNMFLVIDTLEGWQASPLRWYSPITSLINEVPQVGIVVRATGWTSLLRASACLAFCSMTYTQLNLLATSRHKVC